VSIEQLPADAHQRLVARQALDPSLHPGVERAEEAAQGRGQRRIPADHRARDGEIGAGARRHGAQQRGLQVEHPPAAGGTAQRTAVVHLARVGGDEVARVGPHGSAPAGGVLRAALDESDPVGLVPVAGEVPSALEPRLDDAGPGNGEDGAAVHGRPAWHAAIMQAGRAPLKPSPSCFPGGGGPV
jgi:hypothetical protein